MRKENQRRDPSREGITRSVWSTNGGVQMEEKSRQRVVEEKERADQVENHGLRQPGQPEED